MLDKLEALVFGFEEFEKAKIDERFNQIPLILNDLKIKELKDFEILENVIFKIKELLRVKSSNLNSIVRNPKKKLSKKQVLEIITKLDELKYSFLQKAFTAIKKEESSIQPKQEISQPKSNLSNLEIFSNDKVKVTIENGKVPFILLNFKEELDFVLIKNLSIMLFDSYNCHGTNILSEENRVLIIPRLENDNLFTLPKIQVDIDEIYSKLNKVNNSKQAEYKEVNDNQLKRTPTRERADDSLDALLFESKDTTFTKKPELKEDKSKIELEKEEPIEVKVDKSAEIIVEKKKEPVQITEEKKPEIREEKPIENNIKQIEKQEFEVYRDDKIVVYLKTNSKVAGELIIENIFGIKLSQVPENVLTYSLMFAKIFGAVLFETKEAHGTNIIYDFNESKIRVIPRYQNDELPLLWNLNPATDEDLDSVRDKLLRAMSEAMNPKKKEEKVVEKKEESKSDVKKKAEHILQSLRRIP